MNEAVAQFGRSAERYAATQMGRYPAETVLDMVEPHTTDRHLDVGTGPGTLVRLLGRHVAGSVGIDPTPEMLGQFRRHAPDAHPVLAAAERLPFDDHAFTLVTCGSVFHHLAEPRLVAAEICRVLEPGGRFLLIDMAGPEDEYRRAVRDLVERVRDPGHGRILAPSQARAILWEAGFDVRKEESQTGDVRDEDWVALTGADLAQVRDVMWRHRDVAAGFSALREADGGFVFRRDRRYYLGVKAERSPSDDAERRT